MSIFQCIDYLSGLGFHPNSFIVGPLTGPLTLNIRQLPDEMLLLVRNELTARINQRPGFLLENGLINLSKYLEQPFSRDTKQLFEYLNRLDNKRNLDSTKIFKDIYNYGNQTF